MSPSAAPALPARCGADERLLARAMERIEARQRWLVAQAERLAELFDEHARLHADFEEHLRTCGAPTCSECGRLSDAADVAFNRYCATRGLIGAV